MLSRATHASWDSTFQGVTLTPWAHALHVTRVLRDTDEPAARPNLQARVFLALTQLF